MNRKNLHQRRGLNQTVHRTSLLVGGRCKEKRSGIREHFTILSSSHEKKSILKVLSPNRNPVDELYRLFPQLPPGEEPLNGFTCALHKDILLQGKMLVCSNCICFHSNIFGYETKVIIYLKNIVSIQREKTAFVVPNAISIVTLNKRYFFCSFLSRETVFKMLLEICKVEPYIENGDEISDKVAVCDFEATEKIDENRNHMFATSNSYESSVSFQSSYMDRPHTSPPSLNVVSVIPSSNSGVNYSAVIQRKRLTMKAHSISDVRELGKRKIKKLYGLGEGTTIDRRKDWKLHLSQLKDSLTSCCVVCREHLTMAWSNHSSIIVVTLLLSILCLISLALLIRIHNISNHVATNHVTTNPFGPQTDYRQFKKVFKFRDHVHAAKVTRMKSMLSLNLETVKKVQKALKELRENLT